MWAIKLYGEKPLGQLVCPSCLSHSDMFYFSPRAVKALISAALKTHLFISPIKSRHALRIPRPLARDLYFLCAFVQWLRHRDERPLHHDAYNLGSFGCTLIFIFLFFLFLHLMATGQWEHINCMLGNQWHVLGPDVQSMHKRAVRQRNEVSWGWGHWWITAVKRSRKGGPTGAAQGGKARREQSGH